LSGQVAEELSVLVELQQKDMEIRKLIDSREALPAVLKAKQVELEAEEARLREKQEELKAVSKRRKTKDADLEDVAEKIKKLEGQLLKVGTNKEYEAILTEIKNVKELRSTTEGELIKLMEQEEEVAADIDKLREDLEPRVRETEQYEHRMKMELEHKERLIPALRRHREEIAGRLSQATRARYERIAKGKNGVAVVAVAKGACGGCFTALPAQRINEIKISDRLVICEYCGRILVWNEGPAGEGGQA
jgi:predicted  nucleic acid-binding Zn-ribbon protein